MTSLSADIVCFTLYSASGIAKGLGIVWIKPEYNFIAVIQGIAVAVSFQRVSVMLIYLVIIEQTVAVCISRIRVGSER